MKVLNIIRLCHAYIIKEPHQHDLFDTQVLKKAFFESHLTYIKSSTWSVILYVKDIPKL